MIVLPSLGGPETDRRGQPPWLLAFSSALGDSLVVAVSGEADVSTAPQLRAQLDAAVATRPVELVVDLADLTFCDSAGLAVLQEAATRAAAAGVPLTYRGMSDTVVWLWRAFPDPGLRGVVLAPAQAVEVGRSS